LFKHQQQQQPLLPLLQTTIHLRLGTAVKQFLLPEAAAAAGAAAMLLHLLLVTHRPMVVWCTRAYPL
jgi:hypothetical protein